MKRVLVQLSLVTLFASALYAGAETYGSKNTAVAQPCSNWYAEHEWNVTCKTVAAPYEREKTDKSNGGHRPPLQACDGLFDGEAKFGRVTGNNVVSWTPSINDWYETVKLNYGFDFREDSPPAREYPNADTPDRPIPDTWQKVDAIIAYWQQMGWTDSVVTWLT